MLLRDRKNIFTRPPLPPLAKGGSDRSCAKGKYRPRVIFKSEIRNPRSEISRVHD
jgi:hypothetical protein